MKRIILSIVWGLLTGWAAVPCLWAQSRTGTADREIWVKTLVRLADPLLSNLANETLKKEMPYESLAPNRQRFSYLEAVGRTVCGIAPWLELGEDDTPEGQLRKKYIELTVKGISNAVNPSSPDYLIFGEPSQPLVDAAFLAEGLLRAPKQLWGNLSPTARKQVVTELKRSRVIKPNESNWLLFASIVEAALQEFTGECDTTRLNYGVRKFRDLWYKGDAQYGDGAEFHLDYYNSFVIHPMLTDVLVVMPQRTCAGTICCGRRCSKAACPNAFHFSGRNISGNRTFDCLSYRSISRIGTSSFTASPSATNCSRTGTLRHDESYREPIPVCYQFRHKGLVEDRFLR